MSRIINFLRFQHNLKTKGYGLPYEFRYVALSQDHFWLSPNASLLAR
jgi:hypothetical protein